MDRPRPPTRVLHPAPILLHAPTLPQSWLRLLRYPCHLLVSRVPVGWYQLFSNDVFHHWILRPVLDPQAIS